MITNGLIIIGAIFAVAAMVVFVVSLAKAPEAVEDEGGFHFRKAPKSVRHRSYSVRSAAARPTKVAAPFKAHLPSTASAVPWDF
jgi:hypothetical protein